MQTLLIAVTIEEYGTLANGDATDLRHGFVMRHLRPALAEMAEAFEAMDVHWDVMAMPEGVDSDDVMAFDRRTVATA